MLQKHAQKDWGDLSAASFFLKLKRTPWAAFCIVFFKKKGCYIRNKNFPSSPWKPGSGSHLVSKKEMSKEW